MTRTVADWVLDAMRAETEAIAGERLSEAMRAAEVSYDWRGIVQHVANVPGASPALVANVCERALEAAREERDVWGFRDVATLKKSGLNDPGGAKLALDACLTLFRDQTGAAGYEWVLLAQGFVETCEAREAARQCLELGHERALAKKSVEDLVSIASEWAREPAHDEGREMLRAAETLATLSAANAWTLANAWRELAEPEMAQRILDETLERATTVADAVTVAKAHGSHQREAGAKGALLAAARLAESVDDWCAIAEAGYDLQFGELVREALDQAEATLRASVASETPLGERAERRLRGRLARAYRHWLHDEATAARLGGGGVEPDVVRTRVRSIEGFRASASDLFHWLCDQLEDEELAEIAHADYGMDAPKHFAALTDMCTSRLVPDELGWEPHEVLALTRWSSGEQTNHKTRAFACLLLSMVPHSMEEFVVNGPLLLQSCRALGPEATKHLESFLVWRGETEGPEEGDDAPSTEYLVALVLLVLNRRGSDATAALSLARARIAHLVASASAKELAELTDAMTTSMSASLWKELLADLAEPASTAGDSPLAQLYHRLSAAR